MKGRANRRMVPEQMPGRGIRMPVQRAEDSALNLNVATVPRMNTPERIQRDDGKHKTNNNQIEHSVFPFPQSLRKSHKIYQRIHLADESQLRCF